MKLVAEIGLSHEGSLGRAATFIEAVKMAGVDAVKFQCHDGDPCDKFRPRTFFPQDKTRREYWHRTAFTRKQWAYLSDLARQYNIQFGCSVFASEGIDTMDGIVDFWKVPSSRLELLDVLHGRGDAVLGATLPIYVSTGMATRSQTYAIFNRLKGLDCLMECVSLYPTPAGLVHHRMWQTWKAAHCLIGYSDHSGTIWPTIQAAAYGYDVAEVHVCMSRHDYGPDVSSSVTIDELKQLVDGVRFIELGMTRQADQDEILRKTAENIEVFK